MNKGLKKKKEKKVIYKDNECCIHFFDDILTEDDFSTEIPSKYHIERVARALEEEKKYKRKAENVNATN